MKVTVARISSLESIRSGRRLAERLRGHDDVITAAQAARASLQAQPRWVVHLARWDDALVELFQANLGDAVVLSFLRLSQQWPAERAPDDLVVIGVAVREIGSVAGSRVAHALL